MRQPNMSAIDFTNPMGMSSAVAFTSRVPVDLTVPSAFCSMMGSSGNDGPRSASPSYSGLLPGIPQTTLHLAPQPRHTLPSNRLKFYFPNQEFLRFPSPPSPTPPSPPRQFTSPSVTHPDLNKSFPPTSYKVRHFHEMNQSHGRSESPLSSTSPSSPDRSFDRETSPERQLNAKMDTERKTAHLTSKEREQLERFPPAKRFIRALPLTPSVENDTLKDNGFPSKSPGDTINHENSYLSDIDDDNRNNENREEMNLSFQSTPTIPSSFHNPYLSFTSPLPSSPPSAFHSSLFPMSFVTSQLSKPNLESTPPPPLKRRHSANNPIVVDSSIPFTTYLHNLTLTLQQATAARTKSAASNSDFIRDDENETSRLDSENTKPNTKSESKEKEPSLDSTQEVVDNEPTSSEIKKEEDDQDNISSKSDEDDEEEVEERVLKSSEAFHKDTSIIREKRKRKHFHGSVLARDLFMHGMKQGEDRNQITHPLSAPILTSTAFNISPDSPMINPAHLHGHHPYTHHQQQHPQALVPPQSLQGMTLPSLRSPRSPRDQPVHLFSSLYSKLFPPFPPSPNPGHLNLASSQPGQAQPLGGLSSPTNRVNSLFHPSFLHLGNLSMRRTSADKPPPVKKYKCDVCQKAFSRSNTLVTHKRIHTGDKPFKCEICGRAFRQPGNLTRHRLTHTTHKPYVCHVCNKAFNRASNLNTHIRTHSSFRQFGCDGCPKNFHFKHEMTNHVFPQNGERLFKCDICGRGFAHSSTLATHRRTHLTTDGQTKAAASTLTTVFG